MTDPLAYVAALLILLFIAWIIGCIFLATYFVLRWAIAKLKA